MPPQRVVIVVFDGVQSLDVTGPLEVFTGAGKASARPYEHPGADLSVPALARRANLSPRQFSRAFAAEVGTPPGRYVGQVRLEAARRLLEEGRDGVEEVARTCGYGTPEAMRRAFVRELGVAPAGYRERC
nr:hypothetical protein GCM10020063_012740 [Dactylosporangium thailandense]